MKLREAFLAASKPTPRKVAIEGIDAEVFIRVLTVGEILEQQEDVKDGENRPAIARAMARVVVDENNALIYDPKSADDIAEILTLPWIYVRAIMEHANTINGLVKAEQKN